jgi:hypothetical protein
MSKQDEYAGKDKVACKKCGTTRVYKSELRRGDGMCSQCKDDSLTVREIDEEIQDVLAWGYILHERLRVLRVSAPSRRGRDRSLSSRWVKWIPISCRAFAAW